MPLRYLTDLYQSRVSRQQWKINMGEVICSSGAVHSCSSNLRLRLLSYHLMISKQSLGFWREAWKTRVMLNAGSYENDKYLRSLHRNLNSADHQVITLGTDRSASSCPWLLMSFVWYTSDQSIQRQIGYTLFSLLRWPTKNMASRKLVSRTMVTRDESETMIQAMRAEGAKAKRKRHPKRKTGCITCKWAVLRA